MVIVELWVTFKKRNSGHDRYVNRQEEEDGYQVWISLLGTWVEEVASQTQVREKSGHNMGRGEKDNLARG